MTLTAPGGAVLGTHRQPMLWDPMLYHCGRNWALPSDGADTMRVRVDPPEWCMRHDEVNGHRFVEPVELEFTGVTVHRRQH